MSLFGRSSESVAIWDHDFFTKCMQAYKLACLFHGRCTGISGSHTLFPNPSGLSEMSTGVMYPFLRSPSQQRQVVFSECIFIKIYLFQLFTMMAMWSIPVLMSAKNQWWRFIIIWSIFTMLTALVIRKSTYRPMSVTTPRLDINVFF